MLQSKFSACPFLSYISTLMPSPRPFTLQQSPRTSMDSSMIAFYPGTYTRAGVGVKKTFLHDLCSLLESLLWYGHVGPSPDPTSARHSPHHPLPHLHSQKHTDRHCRITAILLQFMASLVSTVIGVLG